jgi:protein-S-isoprenylcysteine O-methyltransferase Ste14
MALQEELEKQGTWLFRYRGTLPLIILLIGTLVYIRTEFHPQDFFLQGTPHQLPYQSFCLLVSLLGLAIRIYTVGHTPKNTSGRNITNQVADTLNTTGIYSLVRHPLYVGNFFMWLGPALLSGNLWFIVSFCLFYWLYYERIMFAEEQFLRRKFGEPYLRWAERVPAFIPHFKGFKKAPVSFNWKKVLKGEKNGLAATFLIFLLFDYAGTRIEKEPYSNYHLLGLTLASLLLYVVVKVLKLKTRLLDEEVRQTEA